jgi:hypothetical protein
MKLPGPFFLHDTLSHAYKKKRATTTRASIILTANAFLFLNARIKEIRCSLHYICYKCTVSLTLKRIHIIFTFDYTSLFPLKFTGENKSFLFVRKSLNDMQNIIINVKGLYIV